MHVKRRYLAIFLGLMALGISKTATAREESVPDLAGQWSWKWQDAEGETHRHVLEVEGKPPKLAARERFDDLPPVRVDDLKLEKDEIRFTVRRGEKTARYEGKVAGPDTINGKVTILEGGQSTPFGWTARRERPQKTGP